MSDLVKCWIFSRLTAKSMQVLPPFVPQHISRIDQISPSSVELRQHIKCMMGNQMEFHIHNNIYYYITLSKLMLVINEITYITILTFVNPLVQFHIHNNIIIWKPINEFVFYIIILIKCLTIGNASELWSPTFYWKVTPCGIHMPPPYTCSSPYLTHIYIHNRISM